MGEMRRLALAVGIMLFSWTCQAQDVPRIGIFGGYSYLNVDTNGLITRQGVNGWEAAVSGNFNRWFALEGDVSGYYKSAALDLSVIDLGTVNGHVRDYGFLGGPRVNFRPFFVHALVGGDRLSGSASGVSRSQTSFAGAFGGGVEWPVVKHWAIRASADYVLTQHNIFGGPAYTQNNYRFSGGLVYLFGGNGGSYRSHERHTTMRSTPPSTTDCFNLSEAPLLGVTGCTSPNGFLVFEVHSGSPAALAGVNPSDEITHVDDRHVETSRDIEAAIAEIRGQTVKLRYMIKGTWVTEQEVRLR